MILAFAEQSDLERDIWLLDLHATDLPSSRDKILALRGGQDQVVTTWVQERDYGLHGPMANDHVNVYLSLTSNTEQKHAIVAHLPTNRKVPLRLYHTSQSLGRGDATFALKLPRRPPPTALLSSALKDP